MTDTEELTPQKMLQQLKEVIKALPLNERKQAVVLYSIFEQVVQSKETEDKLNEASYKEYSSAIEGLTTQMDEIIEGKRKVTADEIGYWREKVDSAFAPTEEDNDAKPVKSFWRKFIENAGIYHSKTDLPMLDHLTHVDIQSGAEESDPKCGYLTVTLEFSENEFFSNDKLTVKLVTHNDLAVKSEGTVINWKKDNPTVKKTSKTQKNKRTGQTRTIVKETQKKSFFEVFLNHTEEDAEKEHKEAGVDEEDESEMDLFLLEQTLNDFNDLMPYALEFYLDINPDTDESAGGDGDEEDDEDEDEDEEEEEHPHKKLGHKKHHKDSKKDSKKPSRKPSEAEKKEGNAGDQKPQECKQQ